MVNNIFLGLGSNKGDRLYFLRSAIKKINGNESCKVLAASSVYESTPYGSISQENFYNAVIEIDTGLGVIALHNFLKNIEKELGRKETNIKWGPREIDIDILFLNTLIYDSNGLIIPHPEVYKRDFALIPLIEIAPNFIPPGTKKKICDFDLLNIEKHIIKKLDYPLI